MPVYRPHPRPSRTAITASTIRAKYSQRLLRRACTDGAGRRRRRRDTLRGGAAAAEPFVMRPLDLEAADGGFKSPEFMSPTWCSADCRPRTPRGGPGTPRTPRGGGEPDEASPPAPVPPPLPPQPAVGAGNRHPAARRRAASAWSSTAACSPASRATGLAGGQALLRRLARRSSGARRSPRCGARRRGSGAGRDAAAVRGAGGGSHAGVERGGDALLNGADALRLQLRSATAEASARRPPRLVRRDARRAAAAGADRARDWARRRPATWCAGRRRSHLEERARELTDAGQRPPARRAAADCSRG